MVYEQKTTKEMLFCYIKIDMMTYLFRSDTYVVSVIESGINSEGPYST